MQKSLNFSKNDIKDQFSYLEKGIKAKGHTLIYKMHKYFARRPHNVFRHIVYNYTNPGDVILDPFCGGGVTLVEGISTGRKVIGVDVNPLATFITDCQTTSIPIFDYSKIIEEIKNDIHDFAEPFYTTTCRDSGKSVIVRWFEKTYLVTCPKCNKQTSLENENKFKVQDKVLNGKYSCIHCQHMINGVNAKKVGEKLVSVTYDSPVTGKRISVPPNKEDEKLIGRIESEFESIIDKNELWFPNERIPEHWDRQQEDCLYRKGVFEFKDFFTNRNLLIMSYLLNRIRAYKQKVPQDIYKYLLLTFSATLKYTNKMTISTNTWMDGRPVAWAKHAFWLPYQFVEVNPLEYIRKRVKAIKQGINFLANQDIIPKKVNSFEKLLNDNNTHIIWNCSSTELQIPDESIDAIITDPPYGSNVQYGELTSFWLSWIKDELGIGDSFLNLDDEVLVNRKKGEKSKDYEFYYIGLKNVFSECYRVLKYGRPMVFTFNNKDVKSWYSLIKAAIDAGFYLDPRGVIYQDPIEIYKNTAHTRYSGALHGDFIYTFVKTDKRNGVQQIELKDFSISNTIELEVKSILLNDPNASINKIYAKTLAKMIPLMVEYATTERSFDDMVSELSLVNFESLIKKFKVND